LFKIFINKNSGTTWEKLIENIKNNIEDYSENNVNYIICKYKELTHQIIQFLQKQKQAKFSISAPSSQNIIIKPADISKTPKKEPTKIIEIPKMEHEIKHKEPSKITKSNLETSKSIRQILVKPEKDNIGKIKGNNSISVNMIRKSFI